MYKHPLFWQTVIGLLTLAFLALSWLTGRWLQSRTNQGWLFVWAERLRLMAIAVVSGATAKLQPSLHAAYADGVVTKEEREKLIEEAVTLLKAELGTQGLAAAKTAFGAFGVSFENTLKGHAVAAVDAKLAAPTLLPALGTPAAAANP